MIEDLDYIPTPWGYAAKYGAVGGGSISLDSPAFTGTPTAPTATLGDNSTILATTAFVANALLSIGAGVSLGETSTTAYRGDRGKLAYDHISVTGAVHGATNLNTVSTIVLRDSSGNFSAGTITANITGDVSGSSGSCTGNAATATTAGHATTADSATTATNAGHATTADSATTATTATTAGHATTADSATTATSAGSATTAITCTGNAATATKLYSGITLSVSGAVTGTSSSWDGSTNVSITTTLADSGVTSGTYNSATQIYPLTIDSKGIITSVGTATTITPAWSSISSTPTTLSGYGITDAASSTHNHDTAYLALSGGTLTGNLTLGTTTRENNSIISILSGNSYSAGIELYGDTDGTGYLYVGQSSARGGGISFNGDLSPAFATGESSSNVSFYRKNAGTNEVVFYYAYDSNDVYFRGKIVPTTLIIPNTSSTEDRAVWIS